MVLHEIKLPHTFHRKIVGRLLLSKLCAFSKFSNAKEIGTSRLSVLLIDVHVLPANTHTEPAPHCSLKAWQGKVIHLRWF